MIASYIHFFAAAGAEPFETGDLATWAGAAFSLFTGLVAVVLAVELKHRERRQALVELHQHLTFGEIAIARNTIGTLLYADPESSPSRQDSIEAYFRLVWALQRARNIFRVHNMHWKTLTGPTTTRERLKFGRRQKEATLALTWNLNEIAENVVVFHDTYGVAWNISDVDAWSDTLAFVDVDAVRARRGIRADRPQEGDSAEPALMESNGR